MNAYSRHTFMHISIHERLLYRKLKDKEHEKLEMLSVLFILNTIRYCHCKG